MHIFLLNFNKHGLISLKQSLKSLLSINAFKDFWAAQLLQNVLFKNSAKRLANFDPLLLLKQVQIT